MSDDEVVASDVPPRYLFVFVGFTNSLLVELFTPNVRLVVRLVLTFSEFKEHSTIFLRLTIWKRKRSRSVVVVDRVQFVGAVTRPLQIRITS